MNKNMRKMYTEEQIAKLGKTKLYKHHLTFDGMADEISILSLSNKPYSEDDFKNVMTSLSNGIILMNYYDDTTGIDYLCYSIKFSATLDEVILGVFNAESDVDLSKIIVNMDDEVTSLN